MDVPDEVLHSEYDNLIFFMLENPRPGNLGLMAWASVGESEEHCHLRRGDGV